MSHRAVCSECSWTGDASTLSGAARELDDHRQETGHDVKIKRDLVTDGGQPVDRSKRETHIDDEQGLFIPNGLREFDVQIVFRTPRATIQHFGIEPLGAYYGMVDDSHFGDPDDLSETMNPDLAPNQVRIKPQGEDAVTLTVEADPEIRTDGGTDTSGVEQCPGCGDTGDKLDGDDWQDQSAFFCRTSACGVVIYGDGEMPGYDRSVDTDTDRSQKGSETEQKCPVCGFDLYEHTETRYLYWCETCEREFWTEGGSWFSADAFGAVESVQEPYVDTKADGTGVDDGDA